MHRLRIPRLHRSADENAITGSVLTILLLMITSIGTVRTGHGQDFTGTYTMPSSSGPLTLSIHQNVSSVTGTLVGFDGTRYAVEGDIVIDDGLKIRGELSTTGPVAEFSLYEDGEGDGYRLIVVPYGPDETSDLTQAMEFVAHRASDAAEDLTEKGLSRSDDAKSDEQHKPAANIDQRLIGTWATQVIMNSSTGGIATQIFMEFRADGVMVDLGSRARASFPDAGIEMDGGGGQTALWRTEGDILYTAFPGSHWVALARFEISGNQLFLRYYDGDQKIWYRQ